MELAGKLALVTGGTDGIGREIARELVKAGASVIVAGRDETRLAAMRGEGLEAITADLSSPAGCDALAAAMRGRPIGILVNNAGVEAEFDIDGAMDLAVTQRCIDVNLAAPVRLIATMLPQLRARPEAAIVNVTSGLAIAPRAASPVYCATKAGLKSFTDALRGQLAGSRVLVVEALPPVVETRMTAGNRHKKMPAAECGRQIVAGLAAGRTRVHVGATKWLNIAHTLSPPLARRIMLRY